MAKRQLTARDMMQVQAMKSLFRMFDGTPEERFAKAISVTSDDVYKGLRRDPEKRQMLADWLRDARRSKQKKARTRQRKTLLKGTPSCA